MHISITYHTHTRLRVPLFLVGSAALFTQPGGPPLLSCRRLLIAPITIPPALTGDTPSIYIFNSLNMDSITT